MRRFIIIISLLYLLFGCSSGDNNNGEDMATVTYYFDGYDAGEAFSTSPEKMVDGLLYLEGDFPYGGVAVNAEVQLCNSNTCAATYLGAITKVELRCQYWFASGLTTGLRPVFSGGDGDNHNIPYITDVGWSSWTDITSDTNAPSAWTWSLVDSLDCDAYGGGGGALDASTIYQIEIRVTYVTPPVLKIRESGGTVTATGVAPSGQKLRMAKSGYVFGIRIVDTGDGNASALRIYDGSTTKAIRKD